MAQKSRDDADAQPALSTLYWEQETQQKLAQHGTKIDSVNEAQESS